MQTLHELSNLIQAISVIIVAIAQLIATIQQPP
jgi:hypothetical protein